MYGPYLTVEEIKAKYPNSLVLLANPKSTRYHEPLGGHVILHAPTREEFNRLCVGWDDPEVKHFATLWTGEPERDEIELYPPNVVAEPGAA